MEIQHFEDIRAEFMNRIQQAVYCNVATVDAKGRPRSRVMHVVWDGPTGWVITDPASYKTRHLTRNPYVSLAYISKPYKPVYIDCNAEWITEVSEKLRIWELHKTIPPPLGFDPAPHYGTIDHRYYGLLSFTPWRLELAELRSESLIWRPRANPGGGCAPANQRSLDYESTLASSARRLPARQSTGRSKSKR